MTGEYAGFGFPLAKFKPSNFVFVEDIQFEVDPASRYQTAYVEQPVGALLLSPGGTGINTLKSSDHGMKELLPIAFDDPADGSVNISDAAIGFTRWRIVKSCDGKLIELFKFEATRFADQ